MSRPTAVADQITFWFRSFKELHGRRPSASEAWHEGYDPRRLRRSYGSWFGFVKAEGALTEKESEAFGSNREFFEALEITQMVKSFKMITLLAMIAEDRFPGKIAIGELSNQSRRMTSRIHILKEEFGAALTEQDAMVSLLERNPIDAWVNGRGMNDIKYFSYSGEIFESTGLKESNREELRALTQEVCDYRLSQYLDRLHGEASFAKKIVCSVSHSGGKPILFLPDRDTNPGIPTGWIPVTVGDEQYQANFVKIAVNVLRKGVAQDNCLSDVLRGFFGQDAGQPGKAHQAKFEMVDGTYQLKPLGEATNSPELWREYMRADIPPLWGLEFNTSRWNQGYVVSGNHIFLLVTLNKAGMAEQHQYADKFLTKDRFQWVSQNRMSRSNPSGKKVADHGSDGREVHLFVRRDGKTPEGKAAPFVYCGDLRFVEWEGDNPITVQWELLNSLSDVLLERFD